MAPFSKFFSASHECDLKTGRAYFFFYFHLGIIPFLKMPTLTFPFCKIHLLAFKFVV